MFDYRAEFDRRVEQFVSYLDRMHERAHEIAHGPCFIIFEERKPSASGDEPELTEVKERELAIVTEKFGDTRNIVPDLGDEILFVDLPDEGWRGDDSGNRYVQFSFERNWFCMDMPLETLFRPEAEQILRDRMGFFYLRDRSQFTLYGEDVEGHDPFRKVYVYGDERSAAEDMAYIFFTVWKFPVDSRLYVKSAAFSGKHEWEKGYPVE